MRLDYEKLAGILKSRNRLTISMEDRIPSGVTIPLFDRQDETCILFTLRTQKVKHHKGQVSFPGGAAEEEDEQIIETAIRETNEEVGIPVSSIHPLGIFDEIITISGFHVTPVVARIDWPFTTRICVDEIDRLMEIPIKDLLKPGMPRTEIWEWNGRNVDMYFYDFDDYSIWGATGRILYQFLEVARHCKLK